MTIGASTATITLPSTGRPVLVSRPSVSTPLQSQAPSTNSHSNDSGQPNQFRIDPNSEDKLIQEINPATGEVIGEYSVSEFPALAKGLGLMIDSRV
jgi:hypothetical protein